MNRVHVEGKWGKDNEVVIFLEECNKIVKKRKEKKNRVPATNKKGTEKYIENYQCQLVGEREHKIRIP